MEFQTVIRRSISLCTLTEWSTQHIRDIFEARNDDQALRAIASTFSDNVQVIVNGNPLSRECLIQSVLAMRRSSANGLRVHWQQVVDAPLDPASNRDGSFGGVYTIRGIQKVLPGSDKPIEFERIKSVTTKIESELPTFDIDSRRIVHLVFVASDVRVDRQAAM